MFSKILQNYFPDGKFWEFNDNSNIAKIIKELDIEIQNIYDFTKSIENGILIEGFSTLNEYEKLVAIPDGIFSGKNKIYNNIYDGDNLERQKDIFCKLVLMRIDTYNKSILDDSNYIEFTDNVYTTIGLLYDTKVSIDNSNTNELTISIDNFSYSSNTFYNYTYNTRYKSITDVDRVAKLAKIFTYIKPCYYVLNFIDYVPKSIFEEINRIKRSPLYKNALLILSGENRETDFGNYIFPVEFDQESSNAVQKIEKEKTIIIDSKHYEMQKYPFYKEAIDCLYEKRFQKILHYSDYDNSVDKESYTVSLLPIISGKIIKFSRKVYMVIKLFNKFLELYNSDKWQNKIPDKNYETLDRYEFHNILRDGGLLNSEVVTENNLNIYPKNSGLIKFDTNPIRALFAINEAYNDLKDEFYELSDNGLDKEYFLHNANPFSISYLFSRLIDDRIHLEKEITDLKNTNPDTINDDAINAISDTSNQEINNYNIYEDTIKPYLLSKSFNTRSLTTKVNAGMGMLDKYTMYIHFFKTKFINEPIMDIDNFVFNGIVHNHEFNYNEYLKLNIASLLDVIGRRESRLISLNNGETYTSIYPNDEYINNDLDILVDKNDDYEDSLNYFLNDYPNIESKLMNYINVYKDLNFKITDEIKYYINKNLSLYSYYKYVKTSNEQIDIHGSDLQFVNYRYLDVDYFESSKIHKIDVIGTAISTRGSYLNDLVDDGIITRKLIDMYKEYQMYIQMIKYIYNQIINIDDIDQYINEYISKLIRTRYLNLKDSIKYAKLSKDSIKYNFQDIQGVKSLLTLEYYILIKYKSLDRVSKYPVIDNVYTGDVINENTGTMNNKHRIPMYYMITTDYYLLFYKKCIEVYYNFIINCETRSEMYEIYKFIFNEDDLSQNDFTNQNIDLKNKITKIKTILERDV